MKLAIMQPYLFPYLGYFQLIRAVDVFIIYDDVNYTNRGWINRNNILVQNKSRRFTMELEGASQNKLINEIGVGGRNDKLLKTIQLNYSKAPYFRRAFPVIESILNQEEKNLARFLSHQLKQICDYFGFSPCWIISSDLEKDVNLRAQDKILAICEKLGGTHYVNMPGGKGLYDRQSFQAKGIKLSFIQPLPMKYSQFRKEFLPNLSIIDVMMFNSADEILNNLLPGFDLVKV